MYNKFFLIAARRSRQDNPFIALLNNIPDNIFERMKYLEEIKVLYFWMANIVWVYKKKDDKDEGNK